MADIKTRVSHPESDGRLEQLYRTYREGGLAAEDLTDYYQTLETMAQWGYYYTTTNGLTWH